MLRRQICMQPVTQVRNGLRRFEQIAAGARQGGNCARICYLGGSVTAQKVLLEVLALVAPAASTYRTVKYL
eukprot:scaffold188_cov429-Prasinococcus_capsulatus_cf.AAC.6